MSHALKQSLLQREIVEQRLDISPVFFRDASRRLANRRAEKMPS
jgi:hypothetical protein